MEIINLILTIIGIFVSAVGLYYAVMQVRGLKNITEKYHDQVKKDVSTAQEKIRKGLLISDVTLSIKNIESAIKYVQEDKFELALLRMEDIEIVISNNFLSESYLPIDEQEGFDEAVSSFKDALKTLMKNTNNKENINSYFIIDSQYRLKNYLLKIDNNIKRTLYGK